MNPKEYSFKAKVWLYSGIAAWHFIILPQKISKEIKSNFGGLAGGWGALPVQVAIGLTRWQTSIFWDNKDAAYILPLKTKARKQENIKASNIVRIELKLLV